jgi:hypothetical protein
LVISVMSILLTMAGLPKNRSESAGRAIYAALEESDQFTSRLQAMILPFKKASDIGLIEPAKLVKNIGSEVYTALGVKGFYKVFSGIMSWKDLMTTGVAMTAQLVVWFGSDGIVFFAEIVLLLVAYSGFMDALQVCLRDCPDKP